MSIISDFIASVVSTSKKANAGEHAYRPALQTLFDSLEENVSALNEPKRVKVGAPDFSISRGSIVIGHCEAKNLDVDLRRMKDHNAAQKKRYVEGLENLLYTNCLEWIWYRDGELKHDIRIADYLSGVQPIPERFPALEALLREFIAQAPLSITSSRALSERMAGKAKLIKDVLANSLIDDQDGSSELMNQYSAFKEHLIHDISIPDFADIYAETITYGMFAARLHDVSIGTFSRQEALELLPKSNPFLRNLFAYIAGPNLDHRLAWIIDDLAVVFKASDVSSLMDKYGKTTQRNDPFLHFYEDFLKAYNPSKKDARGVWYTPEPVVNFIVRAVDDALKTEFGLSGGLSDTSQVVIPWDTGQKDKKGRPIVSTKEVHRVQILDPATGTGTFLAEVIKLIAPTVRDIAPGMWAHYVEKDLIPRVHGFELLMASYAMCHLKLDMVLRDFGYEPTAAPPRVSVYLTNSLEDGQAANQTLPFAQWLSNEVKEANKIKRDMPIMVVIGNPPYSGISQNNDPWIESLISSYKVEPGGTIKLAERKHWLNDDYVKFIRMAEATLERSGSGVLGFITNHGFLSNPTFRGMRWHLMETFDVIHVIDLHGNALRKERSPDGSPDKNVFDIKQGVAIVVAVKRPGDHTKKPAVVKHADMWGSRESKYDELWSKSLTSVNWTKLSPERPYLMFYPIDSSLLAQYDEGFSLSDFMPCNQKGIITARDDLVVDFDRDALIDRLRAFSDPEKSDDDIRRRYFGSKSTGRYEPGDTRSWKLADARKRARLIDVGAHVRNIQYRPFDVRYVAYSDVLIDWPRADFMHHFIAGDNLGLAFNRGIEEARPFYDVFVFTEIIQHHSLSNKEANNVAPLYLYPQPGDLEGTRSVNFDRKLYARLCKIATHKERGTPDEIEVFDYIYGVLHCPSYRDTYAEFLRMGFPRIPWPRSSDAFWDVSDKGKRLRLLHLLDPAEIGETPYPFVGSGDNTIDDVSFRGGHVFINENQRFENVPDTAWIQSIGGYQPAQKWLKDRKGRKLSYSDVQHYLRVIKSLTETDRVMKTIQLSLG